jgi:hypothetical protein
VVECYYRDMSSSAVAAFQQAIRLKQVAKMDPDLALVAHCVAQALALTPGELAQVTAGVRAGIASGAFKVSVPHDATGKIDETALPPLPLLPRAAVHAQRPGTAVSERLVTRLVATCGTLTPRELTLVTQGVRAGVAARGG